VQFWPDFRRAGAHSRVWSLLTRCVCSRWIACAGRKRPLTPATVTSWNKSQRRGPVRQPASSDISVMVASWRLLTCGANSIRPRPGWAPGPSYQLWSCSQWSARASRCGCSRGGVLPRRPSWRSRPSWKPAAAPSTRWGILLRRVNAVVATVILRRVPPTVASTTALHRLAGRRTPQQLRRHSTRTAGRPWSRKAALHCYSRRANSCGLLCVCSWFTSWEQRPHCRPVPFAPARTCLTRRRCGYVSRAAWWAILNRRPGSKVGR